jgi:hypothetical protein
VETPRAAGRRKARSAGPAPAAADLTQAVCAVHKVAEIANKSHQRGLLGASLLLGENRNGALVGDPPPSLSMPCCALNSMSEPRSPVAGHRWDNNRTIRTEDYQRPAMKFEKED